MFNPRPLSATLFGTVAAAAIGLGSMTMADEFDLSNMSDDQKAAFGEAVRAYLLKNPGVIFEAAALYEEQQAAQQARADETLVADNLDALYNDGYSWVGGNPEGDITVVEFLDYRCGYCRKAHPEVAELIAKDGNIRLIVKEYPILGEGSLISSRFAIATQIVAGDEAYKAVHEALIAMKGNPGKGPLVRLAGTLGLDGDAIWAEMESEEVTRRISETRALGQKMGINGTPSFAFGDQMVRGYVPLDSMLEIIAELRQNG
ncbi:Disulfide bond formation protein D precursor [Pelagimonas phthalicica]|uniref:Disulfide bond formation protein D n=1 Tax=Pelagimonas phthalicica TaxID=1037362 RepID=A0A238JDL0_9RHOB|nr:protein-disulfide isomerase [Pelagimonas phthalicica]SMX28274.1 Disulfide bond formation protein D precursor [Pelagimonas phthalicica]